jgi:hypothetical protein
MKTFVLGLLLGASLSAYALPTLFTVHLIGHDAAGRTLTATAQGNSLAWDGANSFGATVLTLEYSDVDTVLCDGFGR